MFLRRRPHGGHEIVRDRVCIAEAEVTQHGQEMSNDQIDHGESDSRHDGSDAGDQLENVKSGIAEGKHPLQDRPNSLAIAASMRHEAAKFPDQTYQEAIGSFLLLGRIVFFFLGFD